MGLSYFDGLEFGFERGKKLSVLVIEQKRSEILRKNVYSYTFI
jgi:hypothetical protein